MTPSERQWLQDARRFIRIALVKTEIGDWDTVVATVGNVARRPGPPNIEVVNLLASLANANASDFRGNAAMRAAAIRRLEETKSFIGETLVATTDR